MIIVCSFYYSSNTIRQTELEHTLIQNLNKTFIDEIHLFMEEKDYEKFCKSNLKDENNYNKIKIVKHNNQPKYPELINYCSNLTNKICCICNSDIEFVINENEQTILSKLYNQKQIFFLTRHEYDMSCPLIQNFCGSHDAFIFHSDTLLNTIKNIDLSFINYIQNTSGIEALLTIFFIEKLNYTILNPCFQIKLIHHHKSNVRLWLNQSKGSVGYSSPTPTHSTGIHCKYMIHPCRLSL